MGAILVLGSALAIYGTLNDSLSRDYRLKIYNSLSHIGLSKSDVVDISTIFNAMPNYSILDLTVYAADQEELFEKGIIPINKTGIITFKKNGRGNAIFLPELRTGATLYTRTVSNADSPDISNTVVYGPWFAYEGTQL